MDLVNSIKKIIPLTFVALTLFSGCKNIKKPTTDITNENYSTPEIYKDYDNSDLKKIIRSPYDQIKDLLKAENNSFHLLAKQAYEQSYAKIGICFTSEEKEYDNTFNHNYSLGINSKDTFVINEFNQYAGYKGPISKELIIPNGPTAILSSFFMVNPEKSAFDSIKIPESIEYMDSNFLSDCLCKDFIVDKENEIYSDIDGVLCSKNQDILLSYPQNRDTEKYVLPDSIKHINSESFKQSKIHELILNKNISEIPSLAFSASQIDTMELPSNVKKINNNAFFYSYIKDIKFNEGLETIGEKAFEHCEEIEEFVLPKSLKTIGDQAFNCCFKLKKIYIPKSVEKIDGILYNEKTTTFENDSTIYVEKGSYAESYVKEHGYKFEYYTAD